MQNPTNNTRNWIHNHNMVILDIFVLILSSSNFLFFLFLPMLSYISFSIEIKTRARNPLLNIHYLMIKSHDNPCCITNPHYNDIMMSAMASQITGVLIVCTTVYSGIDQRKHQSSVSLAFVRGIHLVTSGFPSQRASNAENVFIWWCHQALNGKATWSGPSTLEQKCNVNFRYW